MRPNKLLGQNFLTSETIAEDIVRAAEIQKDDTIIEVGPGKGMLTKYLIKTTARIIAVEKDTNLAETLQNTFPESENLDIIPGDILRIYKDIIPEKPYKIVANLPYYLTSHFLRLFLEEIEHKPQTMVLMVQKEVAERIIAQPPHMNLLALSVQAFSTPKIVKIVKKGSFFPQPEVDSAVIKLSSISGEFFDHHNINPKIFFTRARQAFSQKRKMLRNSIDVQDKYTKKRPQDLALEDWAEIIKHASYNM